MDILTQIVQSTQALNTRRKAARSQADLINEIRDVKPTLSLSARVSATQPNVIAEFKRKSPSRPKINLEADPVDVARQYEAGGAAAMSVLTEPDFFAGSPDDLRRIRAAVNLPLLRKDFLVDEYQFYEARAMGADLVLLIARILEPAQIQAFTQLAHELGMEVLCEVHNREELARVGSAPVDFIGVNCRDLKNFSTNLDHLIDMVGDLPERSHWVAESGIHSKADLDRLHQAGYKLFLIGEYLMKSGDPESTLQELRR